MYFFNKTIKAYIIIVVKASDLKPGVHGYNVFLKVVK